MNAGLPRILTKKNTGILDIMIFIIKYCLLLDTNELFVEVKMELNKNIKNNRKTDCNEGFDLIDFFTEDLFTDTKFLMEVQGQRQIMEILLLLKHKKHQKKNLR